MTYAQYCRLNVHVGARNVTVLRKARHKWLRAILREHANAGALFRKFRF